jgi:hypothetical protein
MMNRIHFLEVFLEQAAKLEVCLMAGAPLQIGRALASISHGPVRNAHGVPTFVGASRESIRPGKLLPKQLAGYR